HVSTGYDVQTAVLGLPRIQSPENPPGTWGGHKCSSLKSVIDPFGPGAIREKRLAVLIELKAPWIDQSSDHHVQLPGQGPVPPDSSALQSANPVRRFDMAVDVNGLVEIQAAIRTPAK